MSLLCQTQMQNRLQDVRFYLSSRIRNGGISKESRMELLEVLCLVDPDFDYQEFGLVESAAVNDSLELIHPRDSIGGNSFSFSIPDRGSEGCWECGQWRGHTEWCERGKDKAESRAKAMDGWVEDRWSFSNSRLVQISACSPRHIFINLGSPLSTYPVGFGSRGGVPRTKLPPRGA